MSEQVLLGVSSILVLGMAAQWLAWRLHFPSILLLLIFGFLAGPATGFLDPDELFGEVLFPLVSISVALILFEGGLTLRFSELREVRRAVRNLISIGAVITWLAAGAAAYLVLNFPLSLSILLGAILVVTGPTVVIPLLRHIHPAPRIGSVAKWEGIMIDPVGATLAVLVFEAILVGELQRATGQALLGFFNTILVGLLGGALGALVVVILLRRYWVPDFLQNPVTLGVVVAVFTGSNLFQAESGLLSVTLAGILLTNQRFVPVKHIIEFKENLRVLLISGLFIVLAARLEMKQLLDLDRSSFLFLGALILVARPLSVFASTLQSRLNWRERVFLSWMAPRGIVSAAVASIFSLRLSELGHARAQELMAITFLTIAVTVTLYGLTARPLARWLGVAQEHPQGFLILGAHRWARDLAEVLAKQKLPVLLVDTNQENIRTARMSGLRTYHGNILADYVIDELELDGIGRLLALTPNDEANALACLHFVELFGRAEVYQLTPGSRDRDTETAAHLRGRLLFGEEATYNDLSQRFGRGGVLKVTKLTEEFDFEDLQRTHGRQTLPLFLINENGAVEVFVAGLKPVPRAGHTLISLVTPESS